MDELKIIAHTTYTYETSDGSEFDDELEAKDWQKHLSAIKNVYMLDSEFRPTKDIERVHYVYTNTKEQTEAFNAMSEYLGICAEIPHGTGYYRYDDRAGSFVNMESEIKELHHIIDKLKGGEG